MTSKSYLVKRLTIYYRFHNILLMSNLTFTYFLFPDVLKRWSFQKNRAGIFLVLSGKIMLLFPENMILHLRRKMKDDLSQKIHGNMIFSSNVLKRWSFQEGPRRDVIFLVLSGKMVFFPKNIFFPWAGSEG